jgi:membrane protease YdiL (CAAX protease family)
MDIIKIITLLDEEKSAPSISDIIFYTIIILIVSNITFMVLASVVGVNSNTVLEKEKDKEYIEWKKRNISPIHLLGSELLNSTIYSPIAEELTFRFLLMKIICIKKIKMSPYIANSIQSIIFGSLHMSNSVYSTQTKTYTNLQTLSATITGFVSGWAYIKSNSIIPSLLAHMINNGIAGSTELFGYMEYLKNEKKSR